MGRPRPADKLKDHVQEVIAPQLASLGFRYDGDRVFRRTVAREPFSSVHDKWWPYRGDPQNVARTMNRVAQLIVRYGVPWLARMDEEEALSASTRPGP